ncbi:hypothetical protein, partial [Clavibacter michiganensis]|uniref:hypothetical protein n=1 Tax=Clavibacter michiganensis TaxID=28447 RepID=UPI00292E7D90
MTARASTPDAPVESSAGPASTAVSCTVRCVAVSAVAISKVFLPVPTAAMPNPTVFSAIAC